MSIENDPIEQNIHARRWMRKPAPVYAADAALMAQVDPLGNRTILNDVAAKESPAMSR